MKMENLGIDKTALRVSFDPTTVNIRAVAKQITKECTKVFIPKNDETTAVISYKSEEDAAAAMQKLRFMSGITSINYNILKSKPDTVTPHPGNNMTPSPSAMRYPAFEPFPELPKCAKCFAWPVIRRCGTCGTCYCDVNCQKQDWPVHKEICMPILFVDHALERVVSTISTEQRMRYYAEQKPPIVANSPVPLMSLENLRQPTNLEQDQNLPSQRQGDSRQRLPSVESGEKPPNHKLTQSHSGHRKTNEETVLRQELQRENVHQGKSQQKERSQEKHIQQHPPKRQSQQGGQHEPRQKQPVKNQLKQEPQQKPEPRQSQQNPQEKQLPQEPQQKVSAKQEQSQEPPKEQPQLLNRLPLRALVARAKEDTKRKVLQQASFPPVGSEVKITHVAENTVFLFEAGSGSTGLPHTDYGKIVERCCVGGEASKKYLNVAPVAGDIVYAPFEEIYYRAEVRSTKDDEAIVFFTDFGNTETLEWKKFKEIEDLEIKYADRLIHEVQIENVPILTDFIRKHLQTLEGEAFELSKVVDIPNSKTKIVELRHSKELYHLSEMICKLSKENDELKRKQTASPAVEVPDPKSYVPVSVAELSEVCIPYGEGVELMIIDAGEVYDTASHRLAVIDIARKNAFAKILAEVRQYGEADSNVYSPEETHHLCLVQWDGTWSRAVPLAIGSQKASHPYCLLDLGIIITVESTNVRRFPQALSRKLYVADCIVQNPETLCKLATGGVQQAEQLTGRTITVNVLPKQTTNDDIQQIRIISVD